MNYKLKITGTNKKPKTLIILNQSEDTLEFYVKETIKRVSSIHKMKITTCNVSLNDGTFVKNFNYLIGK